MSLRSCLREGEGGRKVERGPFRDGTTPCFLDAPSARGILCRDLESPFPPLRRANATNRGRRTAETSGPRRIAVARGDHREAEQRPRELLAQARAPGGDERLAEL